MGNESPSGGSEMSNGTLKSITGPWSVFIILGALIVTPGHSLGLTFGASTCLGL